MRPTRQRADVTAALDAVDGFRSAQDLYDDIRAGGRRVGLTTVYRTLQALAEAGEVDVIRKPDGEAIYRRCAQQQHHHHIVCRSCGRSFEVEGDEIEAWTARVAQRYGFSAVTHTVEVSGLCTVCSPA
jgi:Fur family ferric uptake transcriptional regulator